MYPTSEPRLEKVETILLRVCLSLLVCQGNCVQAKAQSVRGSCSALQLTSHLINAIP